MGRKNDIAFSAIGEEETNIIQFKSNKKKDN